MDEKPERGDLFDDVGVGLGTIETGGRERPVVSLEQLSELSKTFAAERQAIARGIAVSVATGAGLDALFCEAKQRARFEQVDNFRSYGIGVFISDSYLERLEYAAKVGGSAIVELPNRNFVSVDLSPPNPLFIHPHPPRAFEWLATTTDPPAPSPIRTLFAELTRLR